MFGGVQRSGGGVLMACVTKESGSRCGWRIRVYGDKRVSIWLGDVSEPYAHEVAYHAEQIAKHRRDWQAVPAKTLVWLERQPKEIQRKLRRLLTDGYTLERAVDDFMHHKRDQVDLKTWMRHESNLSMLKHALGDARLLAAIRPVDLQAAVDALPYQDSTKSTICCSWSSMFSHAKSAGHIAHNPMHDVRASQAVWTYFLISKEGPERIKIGRAFRVRDRFSSIQSGSPVKLALMGVLHGDREQEMHERFEAYRMHGEWFDASEELLLFIDENTTPWEDGRIAKNTTPACCSTTKR